MIQELELNKGKKVLSENCIGHMSYIYMNNPFVVPITYYFDEEGGSLISYSSLGHKIEALRMNPQVSVQVEEIDSLNHWRSVVIYGKYEELSGSTARYELHKFCEGVKKLVNAKEQRTLKFLCDFSSKATSEKPPIVYRINIDEMTARRRDG